MLAIVLMKRPRMKRIVIMANGIHKNEETISTGSTILLIIVFIE